jgi:hypothetical protein
LVSGTLFGPATNFSSFVELFLDSYWFNDVGCPLWREVESIVFSWSYLLILFLRLPQPRGPASCI